MIIKEEISPYSTQRLISFYKKEMSQAILHTIYTATHLFQADVDINTIRAWLGHAQSIK
jgi:hypothetical protein